MISILAFDCGKYYNIHYTNGIMRVEFNCQLCAIIKCEYYAQVIVHGHRLINRVKRIHGCPSDCRGYQLIIETTGIVRRYLLSSVVIIPRQYYISHISHIYVCVCVNDTVFELRAIVGAT